MKRELFKPIVYSAVLTLIFCGSVHFIYPDLFISSFPETTPLKLKLLLIYSSGGAEILAGSLFLLPGSRFFASHFVIRLMVMYLVMCCWHLLNGNHLFNLYLFGRIIIHLFFIYVVYRIQKQTDLNNKRIRQYYKGRGIFSRN